MLTKIGIFLIMIGVAKIIIYFKEGEDKCQ